MWVLFSTLGLENRKANIKNIVESKPYKNNKVSIDVNILVLSLRKKKYVEYGMSVIKWVYSSDQ